MTIQTQDSVQSQVFRPRDYDVFAGLEVDHHSIAATFTDHDRLMRSLRLAYSATQLLQFVRKHFPGQRLAFVYEAGPTGFGLYDELMAAAFGIASKRRCVSSSREVGNESPTLIWSVCRACCSETLRKP
jgi:hypothetical protein